MKIARVAVALLFIAFVAVPVFAAPTIEGGLPSWSILNVSQVGSTVNTSYYPRDTSLPITGQDIYRDVGNSNLNLYGGRITAGDGGIVSVQGATSGDSIVFYVPDMTLTANLIAGTWKGTVAQPYLDMNSHQIKSLANPTNNQDAVTLAYYNANLPSGGIVDTSWNVSYYLLNGARVLQGNLDAGSFNLTNMSYIDVLEKAIPPTPPANTLRLYTEDVKGFSFFSFKDDTGMVRKLVRDSVFVGKNVGANIAAYSAVYASGSSDGVPELSLALATSTATMPAIGITIEPILTGNYGRVMQVGLLENVPTVFWGAGDVLYVSETIPGFYTTTPPVFPNIRQEMGTVLVSDPAVGAVQVIARSMFDNIAINSSYMTTTNLVPYFLNDTSNALYGGALRRNVNNDYLSFYGGNLTSPKGANLQLYGGENVAMSGGFIMSVGNASGTDAAVVFATNGRTDTPTLNLMNNRIVSLQDPVGSQDAVTLNKLGTYVGNNSINSSLFYKPGLAGGQIAYGGTAATDNLTLSGTSSSTKTAGYIALNPDGGNVGINTPKPGSPFEVKTTLGDTPPSILLNGTSRANMQFKTNDPTGAYSYFQFNQTQYDWEVAAKDDTGEFYINNKLYQGVTTAPFILTNAGILSLYRGSSGATAPAVGELILDSSAANGLSILTPTNQAAYITFGDSGDNDIGYIEYHHAYDSLNFFVNAAKRLGISSAGVIQINSFGAGTVMSDASGNLYVVSDDKYKTLETPYTRGLSSLPDPITYKFNTASGLDTISTYVGFSAQNLSKSIPEAVFSKPDMKIIGGVSVPTGTYTLSISDRAILAVAINAIKEQQAIIENQQAQIDDLTKRMEAIEQKVGV